MKSAPHLMSEDRAEFERALDEALRTAHVRHDLDAVGRYLSARQLRGMALVAQSLIAQAAAPEYEHYRQVREELRGAQPGEVREVPASGASPASGSSVSGSSASAPSSAFPSSLSPSSRSSAPFSSSDSASSPLLPRTSVLGAASTSGAGIIAVIAVLVPVLTAIAAVIFLVAGYLLTALGPVHPLADALIAFGWFFASVMALGILAAGVGLVITAVRNGSTQIRSVGTGEPGDLVEAREEWRAALVERGIVPYLRRTLREAEESTTLPPEASSRAETSQNPQAQQAQQTAPDEHRAADRGRGRGQGPAGDPDDGQEQRHHLPKIGYSRPDYSSPGEGAGSGSRPRYSSPDFSSPDYGGPEHRPD